MKGSNPFADLPFGFDAISSEQDKIMLKQIAKPIDFDLIC